MKNSKKGLTLVELVVSTIVGLIVIAAACSTLFFTMNNYQIGAVAYTNHQNTSLAETYLQHDLACASSVNISGPGVTTLAQDLAFITLQPTDKLIVMYFSGNTLVVEERDNTKLLKATARINDITQIDLTKQVPPLDSKQKCNYTIYAMRSVEFNAKPENQGFTINGGVVMNNCTAFDNVSITNKDTGKFLNIVMPTK